ncbi:MAG: hypothetical protein ACOZAK_00695 [Patescibacteria group bacterium]
MLKIILLLSFFFSSFSVVKAGTFAGQLYEDPNAMPMGLGGSDNKCDGSLATEVSGAGFKVKSTRSGETDHGFFMGATYNITTGTSNPDYTVILDLPYPPPDPANAWQCACNANPLDPYQCVYTNQDPTTLESLNFFIKRANANNNAWWQVLGGNIFSKQNIQSYIPNSDLPGYCNNTPGCTPALIDMNPSFTLESPGFAFTLDGSIMTYQNPASVFLHTNDSRSSALQATALSADIPEENYAFFFKKVADKVVPLPSSQKPVPSQNPGIYLHEGDLTINELNSWQVTNTEQIIVFINGSLFIDDTSASEQKIITVEAGGSGFLAFFVKNNIVISPNVGYSDIYTNPHDPNVALVEGVYLADKIISVEGVTEVQDKKFIGAGSFVGWGGIKLSRSFAVPGNNSLNNQSPAEVFIFRPDFLVNTPKEIKSAHFYLRELQPKTIQ